MTSFSVSGSGSHAHVIASLLGIPAILAGLWIGATGVSGASASTRSTATFDSLADAIQHGEVEDAYAFIRAGADPNAPLSFTDPQLTADRRVMVSPLMLAVASNKDNVVMMLLSFGARMDLPQNELAACLARRLAYNGVAEMIVRDGKPPSKVTCPEAQTDARAPLLAFAR